MKWRLGGAWLLSLAVSTATVGTVTGCASKSSLSASSDCGKEIYCGQCASRGGCGWCGDASDGSQGRCVQKDDASCAAPATWSTTPDRCPAPPALAGSAKPLSQPGSSQDSPEKQAIGAANYERVRQAMARAFPVTRITDNVLDGVVQILLRRRQPGQAGPVDPTVREQAPIQKTVQEGEHRLYLAAADHHRVKGMPQNPQPMESRFNMPLPVVRVPLPPTLTAQSSTIQTAVGEVDLRRDHLLGSLDLIAEKYGGADYLGYRPARVDLITPARWANSRFGAMAVYLGYRRAEDRAPSFYLLEAGTATGEAKMIYFSPSMQPIERVTSYYLPTPFVNMRYTYGGGLTMQAAPHEDEPDQLIVRSYAVGDSEPYIIVTVKYEHRPSFPLPLPIELIADAGSRIALIARTMGVSAVELQDLLANLGQNLQWTETPRYVPAASPGTAPNTAR